MGMNLMFPFPTLILEGEFKEGSHIGAFARQSDEDRDISGIIFRVFPVRVKVNGPLVTGDGEVVAGDVLADAYTLGEGVALDGEVVGAVDGLGEGEGGGRGGERSGGRRRRRRSASAAAGIAVVVVVVHCGGEEK